MKDLIEELGKDLLSIHDDLREADDDIQFKVAGCLDLCFRMRTHCACEEFEQQRIKEGADIISDPFAYEHEQEQSEREMRG